MINKAFDIVCNKLFTALEPQGFKKNKVKNADSNEMVSLYTGENVAYSVVYDMKKMYITLRSCTMTEDGPDNEWKTIATWMFDPSVDTEKEASSIGEDFYSTVSSASTIKRVKKTKKKKSADGATDAMALVRRMGNIFPELRYEIKDEEDAYESFRVVTFTKEHIVPHINLMLRRGDKKDINKFVELITNLYQTGDPDVRAIITIVILNNIEDSNRKLLLEMLNDDLRKVAKSALKFKGKKVKPEKAPKKRVMETGNRL